MIVAIRVEAKEVQPNAPDSLEEEEEEAGSNLN